MDPSLLRFLVDVRGAEASAKQLRDDLITLLIAGHETTGSMLTWATWLLSTTMGKQFAAAMQSPGCLSH